MIAHATTSNHEPPPCNCRGDVLLARLDELVAAGADQRTASQALWGREGERRAALTIAGMDARRMVREAYAAAFPWLTLPPEVTP